MRAFLLTLVCAFTGASTAHAATAAKPNIIFILADDLGLPALGCTGGIYKTPNLDALAKGGIRFETAYSAPLCGPTRATLLTGRYVFRTGVITNAYGTAATPEKDGCVALRLKEAGYTTAVAGKWRQLSHFVTKEDGAKWGFDEFLIWGAGQAEEEEAPVKGKRKAALEKGAAPRGDRYWTPDYNLNGRDLKDAGKKYGPDVLSDFVLDFVRRHKDESFFVYYPTPLIHGPILHTPDSKSQDGAKQRMSGKQAAEGNVGEGSHYADNIAYLDKLVGKLVAEIDALGLREKTLIMFGGDNGSVPIGLVHGRPVDGKKGNMLEGGARVPLIANWRGTTPAGVVLKDLIDYSDMLPTFVELGGAPSIAGRVIDGRSFAPQLRGEKGSPREWVYVQLGENRYVRSPRWKLTGAGEFFDMQDAPHRQIAVPRDTNDAEAKAARVKLQAALDGLKPGPADGAATETSTKKKRKKKA